MKLIEKQRLFARLLAEFMYWTHTKAGGELWGHDQYVDAPDWPQVELRLAEGYVKDTDDAWIEWEGYPEEYVESSNGVPEVHRRDGGHFKRIAQDLVLDIDGEYIADGSHPAWRMLGEYWEGLHPLCRWGGRWGDANHFSLEDGGVS